LRQHSGDAWLASHLPDAVVFAQKTQTVSEVMQFSQKYNVPVTVRGGGVGYVGGCVPVRGGIVLSLAKMNRIREIHPIDGIAEVEPGVITGDLQDEAKKKGLFYPPDPASLRECTIGGNIATNAGGPRCLKYGVTRHYVLGLEVVLANGDILHLGGRTHKNKTGFDFVGPFVGSEGMLGTVTRATLRLLPHPPSRACVSAEFTSEIGAARAVQSILTHGFLPSALEIADSLTLQAASEVARCDLKKFSKNPFLHTAKAFLLVEIDGQKESVRAEVRDLVHLIRRLGGQSVSIAHSESECEKLWNIRREFSRSLKATGLRKLNEDIAVPRSRLVDLLAFSKKLQSRFGIRCASFGHAGDGNIHVNLMLDETSPHQKKSADQAVDALFKKVLQWGGVITGEHGIGLAKKPWWSAAVGKRERHLHQQLKSMLDPHHLLNPGKFLDP
jgi:glycolate oxidase